ncbi:MAG: hypothetical protein HRT45_12955 [Bdellovibrionales bacterium]|nr:hypothetical protein [Bdellovibrionales bacterium]
MKSTKLKRRQLFKIGTAAAVTAAAGAPAFAATCRPELTNTPTQPLGPFFPREQTPKVPIREDRNPETPIYLANDNDLTFIEGSEGVASGQICLITGKLTDKNSCEPIAGATIIIWQASSTGLYNHISDSQNESFTHPVTGETMKRQHDGNFQYWGKAVTDKNGNYAFKTIVPGFYPANLQSGWYRPPHIHFMIAATGKEQHVTQMYFRGAEILDNDFNQELNSRDFLLQNPDLTDADKEALVVDFKPGQLEGETLLKGQFDLKI